MTPKDQIRKKMRDHLYELAQTENWSLRYSHAESFLDDLDSYLEEYLKTYLLELTVSTDTLASDKNHATDNSSKV